MIWLPRFTDNSTYFAQSLEIRGIESRLYVTMKVEIKVIKTLVFGRLSLFKTIYFIDYNHLKAVKKS